MVLTNGDVDHVAGLLSMRERQPFTIYATERVLGVLASNSIFNVLDPAPRAGYRDECRLGRRLRWNEGPGLIHERHSRP